MSWRTLIVIAGLCLPAPTWSQVPNEFTRLVRIPSAAPVPDGHADFRYDVVRDPGLFAGTDRQQNFSLSFGFLSRLTLSARATIAADAVTGVDLVRDLSASAQFLLLKESASIPAIGVGLQDIGGAASKLRARYVTLGKSVRGRIRGTAGYGIGPDVLDGAFGGAELALGTHVSVLGEYDGESANGALRVFPLPEKWIDRGVPRPAIDVVWQAHRTISMAFGLRTSLGGVPPSAHFAHKTNYHRVEGDAPTAEELQAELIARGFENVRVAIAPLGGMPTVSVEFENRRYNRSEVDGIGLAMGLAALRTPGSVKQIRLIVKQSALNVLALLVDADAFVDFLNERISAAAFRDVLRISENPRGLTAGDAPTAAHAPSRLKLDVFVHPRIETTLLTEWGVADARFSVLPEVQVQLYRGAGVAIRGAVPLGRTENYPGVVGDAILDRALFTQAFSIPLAASRTAVITQLNVGRFDPSRVGVGGEIAASFAGGTMLAKVTALRLGDEYRDLSSWVAFGDARFRYTPLDAALTVSAGRFLDGDDGFRFDGSRLFGATELGFFARHTNNGTLAGARVALPLTVRKELMPARIRLRLPDLYSYEHRSVVREDRNVVRSDIGRVPLTDREIERRIWDRDRLHEVYLLRHVDLLRRAVVELMDDNS